MMTLLASVAGEVAVKKCPRCGEVKSATEFYANPARHDGVDVYCKPCKSAYSSRPESLARARERRDEDREHVLARRYAAEAANMDRVRERRRNWNRAYTDRMRKAVFDHYGWACARCGSTERLTIDHVNEDGYAHRESLFGKRGGKKQRGGAYHFYGWLVRNGFPDGFQTLCSPCNTRKQNQARRTAKQLALESAGDPA